MSRFPRLSAAYWATRATWFNYRLMKATRGYLKMRVEELLPTNDWPLEYLPGKVLVLAFPQVLKRRHVDALFIAFAFWVQADPDRRHEYRELRIARLCEMYLQSEPWQTTLATVDRVSAK